MRHVATAGTGSLVSSSEGFPHLEAVPFLLVTSAESTEAETANEGVAVAEDLEG